MLKDTKGQVNSMNELGIHAISVVLPAPLSSETSATRAVIYLFWALLHANMTGWPQGAEQSSV